MNKALRWFLSLYIFFFSIALIALYFIEKGDWVIYLNQNRSVGFDYFFAYWTHLGDGVFATLLVVTLLLIKYRYAVVGGITVIAVAIASAILKLLVFPDSARPKKYLAGIYELDLIDWVNVHSHHSFPSGHTTLAFAIATFLTMIARKGYLGAIFILYAVLVGISRNYLSQHFLEDITAGSLIGIMIALVTWFLFKSNH